MQAFLQKLVETPGPPGREDLVRDLVYQEIAPMVDEVLIDGLGNLIAMKKGGAPDARRVMLCAHLDESGVVVKHIDDHGFARFEVIGRSDPRSLFGKRIQFPGGVRAIVGCDAESGGQPLGVDQLFLDFGVAARSIISIGDMGVFDEPLIELGDRWVGKALDDRIGVAILVETIRQLENCPHDLYFAFVVQNEVGGRGATTATYGINPDLGLVLDLSPASDIPKAYWGGMVLGRGPGIKLMDGNQVIDRRLVDWIVACAEQQGLPYQMEVAEQSGDSVRAIMLARAGVPAGSLTIPVRYGYTGSEMVARPDVTTAFQLVLALLAEQIPWL